MTGSLGPLYWALALAAQPATCILICQSWSVRKPTPWAGPVSQSVSPSRCWDEGRKIRETSEITGEENPIGFGVLKVLFLAIPHLWMRTSLFLTPCHLSCSFLDKIS